MIERNKKKGKKRKDIERRNFIATAWHAKFGVGLGNKKQKQAGRPADHPGSTTAIWSPNVMRLYLLHIGAILEPNGVEVDVKASKPFKKKLNKLHWKNGFIEINLPTLPSH